MNQELETITPGSRYRGATPEQTSSINKSIADINAGILAFNKSNTPIDPATQDSGTQTTNNLESLLGGASGDTDNPESAFVPSYLQDMNASTNPADYRQNYINMFQDRINALNQVFDQQLKKAQAEGVGRVGQGTAILARRGIAGSPRAGSIQEGILEQNRGIENAIQEERNLQIQAIYDKADELAMQEAAEKRRAKETSTQNYISYLKGEEERKGKRATTLASALLSQGIDLKTLSVDDINKLADRYKVSTIDLSSAYKALSDKQNEEKLGTEKTQAEIDKLKNEISQGKWQTISDGSMLYNPVTKELIENPESYKPTSGGAGGLTPYQQFQGGMSLASKVDKLNEGAKTATRMASLAQQAYDRYARGETKDLNATTQVIITNFNKILDPASVVRESEYARSPEGQSLLGNIEGRVNKLSQGGAGLTAQSLKEFVDLGNTFAKNAQQSIEREKQRAVQYGEKFGIDTSYVGGGYVPNASYADPQVQELYDAGYSQAQIDEILTK